MASKTYRNCTRTAHLSAYTWPFRSAMNRVPNGFTTDLNFKLGDRPPPDKIALAEGGTVLFETRSIDTVGGTTAFDLSRPGTRDRFGAKA